MYIIVNERTVDSKIKAAASLFVVICLSLDQEWTAGLVAECQLDTEMLKAPPKVIDSTLKTDRTFFLHIIV